VPYLIDGYNLLFSYLGTPPSRKLSKALERARRRLLELVRTGHAGELADVTVVFDAAHAPAGAPSEFDYHGLHVAFAVDHERADDLIEAMIRRESAPAQLTVVTDDRHIQRAARRRRCIIRGCASYLNTLEDRRPDRCNRDARKTARSPSSSDEEMRHWLGQFADLERDPAMKELSDPYGAGMDDVPME
jgi:predicted RNA-binding protein with PIN domain